MGSCFQIISFVDTTIFCTRVVRVLLFILVCVCVSYSTVSIQNIVLILRLSECGRDMTKVFCKGTPCTRTGQANHCS